MRIEVMNLETSAQPVRVATLNPANLTGLADCIEDARRAALDREPGRAEPRSYHSLLAFLETMHDQNPSWGPLFVAHPGNIARHLTYCRALDKPETVPVRSGARSLRPSKRSVSPPKRSMIRSLRKHSR